MSLLDENKPERFTEYKQVHHTTKILTERLLESFYFLQKVTRSRFHLAKSFKPSSPTLKHFHGVFRLAKRVRCHFCGEIWCNGVNDVGDIPKTWKVNVAFSGHCPSNDFSRSVFFWSNVCVCMLEKVLNSV